METTSKDLQTADGRPSEAVETTRPGPLYTPTVDIYEEKDRITLVADLPGVHTDHLHVDLRDGVLTLRGEVTLPEQEGEVEVLHEVRPGTFFRQFRLAETIDQERIDAKLKDGVLTLQLPKVEAAKPRHIPVQIA